MYLHINKNGEPIDTQQVLQVDYFTSNLVFIKCK